MVFLTTMWITPLSSAWTLAFESYFYVTLTVIIVLFGRHTNFGILVWLILQTVWIGFVPSTVWDIGSNELIYEFAFGWLVALLQNRAGNKTALLAAAAALALWIFGAWLTAQRGLLMPTPRVETFGIASALLLYASLRSEVLGWRAPRFLQRLGDVSYSIYLWHMIILGMMYTMFPVNGWTLMAAMALLIIWSFISYALIEKAGIWAGNRAANTLAGIPRHALGANQRGRQTAETMGGQALDSTYGTNEKDDLSSDRVT